MRSNSPFCRGFTLIELLVSIAIIAILITLVTIGVGHALRTSKGAADRQTVVSLNQGVQAFKQEFGFLPPLVTTTSTIRPVEIGPSGAPVPNTYGGTVVNNAKTFNQNTAFLEGFCAGSGTSANPGTLGGTMMSADWTVGTPGAGTAPDARFSEYSLAYFLVGALGKSVDGVEGPGMFRPKSDGTFEFTQSNSARVNKVAGREYPPFVDTARNSPRLVPDLAKSETADSDLLYMDPESGTPKRVMSRYQLQSPSGKAYRYYRWAPRRVGPTGQQYYNPATDTFTRAEEPIDLLNVPSLLGDPRNDANLRAAEYAIVSCGPDGYFGDMWSEAPNVSSLAAMSAAVRDKSGKATSTRDLARKDNIVEVGR